MDTKKIIQKQFLLKGSPFDSAFNLFSLFASEDLFTGKGCEAEKRD